jgi:hypothetical protein
MPTANTVLNIKQYFDVENYEPTVIYDNKIHVVGRLKRTYNDVAFIYAPYIPLQMVGAPANTAIKTVGFKTRYGIV